ncbi:MAG: hypothetical protein P4L55_19450, partial [Syntrophobacteraceae bacterium]|nr:hypothetical protein [Syntrophobacteraceae bacterium]
WIPTNNCRGDEPKFRPRSNRVRGRGGPAVSWLLIATAKSGNINKISRIRKCDRKKHRIYSQEQHKDVSAGRRHGHPF